MNKKRKDNLDKGIFYLYFSAVVVRCEKVERRSYNVDIVITAL
jgi:hypothetical protein